jgi:hypothetical protein
MTVENLRYFFAYSSAISTMMLIYWVAWLMYASDYVYRIHNRWFKMSKEQFYASHYRGIIYFSIGIFLLNVVPYIALRIIG